MDNCIFCKIINRQIPSSIVFEDEKVIAFEDIHPAAPVHVLIVPKVHVENVLSLKDSSYSILEDIHKAIKAVAEKKGIDRTGFRIISNCGKDGGQTVPHLHYHVLGGKDLGPKII